MNGDKKRVQFTDGKTSSTNLPFRRKTESLDWKKVASIDVEKVIQSSNLEILEELFSQITYCRAEIEFDSESTDSGLLKVFKLSQLIIESLLHSQEILQEKYDKISSLHAEVEEQKTAYVREIQSLKENLQAAKKELKRRKEIIASTQNEVIGDNKDEFDPCPYCNKKFLTSAYLISHMQRRHQGLPIHPVFPVPPPPSQNIFPGFTPTKYIENNSEALKQFDGGKGYQLYSPRQKSNNNNNNVSSKYIVHHQTQDTQTHRTEVEKLISLETIGALVEQCLKQKEKLLQADTLQNQINITPSSTGSKNETNSDNRCTNEQNESMSDNPGTKLVEKEGCTSISHKHDEKSDPHETVVKISEEIKNQLDLQWKSLLQKIQKSGLGELNKHLITDSSEPGEIETKSVTPSWRKSKEKAPFVSKTSVSSENEDESCNKNEPKQNEQKAESSKIPETKIVLEPIVSPIIHINVEERLQKQQDELENLKSNLQNRMHEDKLNIESKLESQERYWQNKLRMVEKKYLDEYSGQLSKLREEFHQSLQKLVEKTSVESSPRVESKVIIMTDQSKQFQNNNGKNNVHSVHRNSETILGHMTQENEEDENFLKVDNELSSALHNMAIRMSNTDSSFQPPKSPLKTFGRYQQQDERNSPDHNISIGLSYSPSKPRSSSLKKIEDQNPPQVRIDQQQYHQKELDISKPIAKPRKASTLQSSSSPVLSKMTPTDSKHDNQSKVLVQARLQDHEHHEYEEPQDIVKLDHVRDYSESESITDSDDNQDEDEVESPEEEESQNEETEDEGSAKLKKEVIPHALRRHSTTNSNNSSKFTIRMLTEDQAALEKRQKMREQCEKELSDQLMSLGYEGCETEEISTKDKNKVLKKLKQRRESIKGLDEVRERIQEEAEIGALAKSIKEKLDNSIFTSPIKKPSKSPLIKILSAVKMSKNSWKKSVRSACKRPSKDRKSPVLKMKSPSPQLKVKSKVPSLFSKARWSKQKKKNDNKETSITLTTPQLELEKTALQVAHSVSGSDNDDDDDEEEGGELTGSNSSTGESRNSEPEIEKTIFVSKKPIMTSTPSNKSPQVKESKKNLQKKKKHWRNKHKDGIMMIETDDDDSDENSLEFEIDEKEYRSEQDSPLPSSPNVLKKKLKVKNNKASKLRYREAARKSAAAAILSKEEKEKTQMNNNNGFSPKGFTNPVYGNTEMKDARRTPNKNPNQNVTTEYHKENTLIKHEETQQKSVRRSLEPQFDKFTPHPTPNLHDVKNDKCIDSFNSESSVSSSSSSSSWDDDNDDDDPKTQGVKHVPHEKLPEEYPAVTSTKYSNNNYHHNFVSTSPKTITKELRNSIQSKNDGTKNVPLYDNKLPIRPSSEASTSQQNNNNNNYNYGNNNQKITTMLNRPQTSKRSTRVALDSWDDDLMSDGENQVEKVQKESPNHNNKITFDKKRPKSLQTHKTTKQTPSYNDSDNYKKSSNKLKEHPVTTSTGKDSPLNNSWDDD